MMKHTALPLSVALTALAVAGCGQSSQEKAQNNAKSTVCDARSDIGKQVDTLKALTPQTFTTAAVTTSLTAIGKDLSTIAGARGDLSSANRQEVESANKAFSSEVRSLIGSLGTTLSADSAATQLTAAVQQLAGTYKNTYGKISC